MLFYFSLPFPVTDVIGVTASEDSAVFAGPVLSFPADGSGSGSVEHLKLVTPCSFAF